MTKVVMLYIPPDKMKYMYIGKDSSNRWIRYR